MNERADHQGPNPESCERTAQHHRQRHPPSDDLRLALDRVSQAEIIGGGVALRSRPSDTTLQAVNGRPRAKTGSTSARRGTSNQRAIIGAPRERSAKAIVARLMVSQKQVSSSRRSKLRNWMIALPRPNSASMFAVPMKMPASAIT